MDFHKLINRHRQFGGIRLVIEYAKIGALWPAVKCFFKCLMKGESYKRIYPEVLQKVEPLLVRRYEAVLREKKAEIRGRNLEHRRNNIIWFCWLQGMENAPDIVKACYSSILRHLVDMEIKIIDEGNWREYVELPDYVLRRWERGRIPAALFSDLLRLELLISHGGTWIDATVLCTGNVKVKDYLNADLFLFQYTNPGCRPVSISNWFITACTNNEVLMVLRDMLFSYWKDYNCTLDYYIFHLFFEMLSIDMPDAVASMPYGQSQNSLMLMFHWSERFDEKKWSQLTERVSIHKLAYRVSKGLVDDKDNYYNYILNAYYTNRNESK